MQDPPQGRDSHVKLRLPQVEQRDEDRRGSRPAPPDDIQDEAIETTILAMRLI